MQPPEQAKNKGQSIQLAPALRSLHCAAGSSTNVCLHVGHHYHTEELMPN